MKYTLKRFSKQTQVTKNFYFISQETLFQTPKPWDKDNQFDSSFFFTSSFHFLWFELSFYKTWKWYILLFIWLHRGRCL